MPFLKKICHLFLTILLVSTFYLLVPVNPVQAASSCGNGIDYDITSPPLPIPENAASVEITLTSTSGWSPGTYRLYFGPYARPPDFFNRTAAVPPGADGRLVITIPRATGELYPNQNHYGKLEYIDPRGGQQTLCGENDSPQEGVHFAIGYSFDNCRMSFTPPFPLSNERIRISVQYAPQGSWPVVADGVGVGSLTVGNNGSGSLEINPLAVGSHHISLLRFAGRDAAFFCTTSINVQFAGAATPRPFPSPTPTLVPGAPTPTSSLPRALSAAGQNCPNSNEEVKTAIGCVPTNPQRFVSGFLRYGVGLGGGVAFLMTILGSFEMITSAGNPEQLKTGRERFTSAAIGLLFIIFSVFLLRVIGVDILGLEGFK